MSPSCVLPWNDWLDLAERRCLTIADVLRMEPGAQARLLVLHRNIGDEVDNLWHFDGVVRPAARFFCGLESVFTKREGLSGRMQWHWGDMEEDFAFQLLSKPRQTWGPLDESGQFALECKHWQEMPLDTSVGWRGFCMRWEDVERMPAVFEKKK